MRRFAMEGKQGNGAEALAQMEQAAQVSSDPQHIKECRATERVPATHTDKIWLAILSIALAVFGGAFAFLNFQHGWLSDELATRARNYARGAVLATGILLVARLLEVFAIGRVANAANRF